MDRFYNAFMDFLKLYIFGFLDSKWMDKNGEWIFKSIFICVLKMNKR